MPAAIARARVGWAGLALALAMGLPAGALSATTPRGLKASPDAVRRALRGHELRASTGERFALGGLRGQVVVVNFWASWCRPCRRELPALARLHRGLAGRGGRVVAISIDHDARNAQRFARTHAPGLPIVHDGPEGLAKALDLEALPLTLVLDRNGEVAYATRGSDEAALNQVGVIAGRLIEASPAITDHVEGDTP